MALKNECSNVKPQKGAGLYLLNQALLFPGFKKGVFLSSPP